MCQACSEDENPQATLQCYPFSAAGFIPPSSPAPHWRPSPALLWLHTAFWYCWSILLTEHELPLLAIQTHFDFLISVVLHIVGDQGTFVKCSASIIIFMVLPARHEG